MVLITLYHKKLLKLFGIKNPVFNEFIFMFSLYSVGANVVLAGLKTEHHVPCFIAPVLPADLAFMSRGNLRQILL